MKNHGSALALLALVLVPLVFVPLVLAAGAAHATAPPQKESAQDTAYSKELEIRDLLLEKGGQSAMGIRVTVDGAKAILTGDVPGRAAQELAEEVALSVDGIKSVDNRLKVKPASGAAPEPHSMTQELADAQLETRVKRQIHDEIGKYSKQIGVEAVDGVVSLRGTLPDANRKQIALDTAGKTKGVKKVIDLIKIKA